MAYILQARNNIWDLLRLEKLFERPNIAYKYSVIILQLRFNLRDL